MILKYFLQVKRINQNKSTLAKVRYVSIIDRPKLFRSEQLVLTTVENSVICTYFPQVHCRTCGVKLNDHFDTTFALIHYSEAP